MNTIQEALVSVFDTNNSSIKSTQPKNVGTDPADKIEQNQVQSKETPLSKRIEEQTNFFEEIRDSLEKINDFMPVSATNLVFEFDELGEPPVVKVIDKSSDEVIREIPPQEIREVAKAFENLADKLSTQSGILFNDSV